MSENSYIDTDCEGGIGHHPKFFVTLDFILYSKAEI